MDARDRMNALKCLTMISQVGITMFVCIAASVWLGKKLDQLLGNTGIVFILCILIGVLAGFMNVYKLLTRGLKK